MFTNKNLNETFSEHCFLTRINKNLSPKETELTANKSLYCNELQFIKR
jgi:hypothetical protein